ncbi:hypothetical protein F5X96DRAFT_508210 [Biscogniauxia mediterranea]|nr:hypothetical protein F5X96DRAFT_508210 [Biscogniauxia mediterranea]
MIQVRLTLVVRSIDLKIKIYLMLAHLLVTQWFASACSKILGRAQLFSTVLSIYIHLHHLNTYPTYILPPQNALGTEYLFTCCLDFILKRMFTYGGKYLPCLTSGGNMLI